MGIKFYCPNGHKLNVKAFLAGKKAICPKCGVKVVVPVDETLGQSAENFSDADELEFLTGERAISAPGGHSAAAGSSPEAAAARPAAAGLAPAAVDAAVAGAAPVGAAHSAAAPGANGPSVVDPIDEAPTEVWYVRPPSGGQFGPASGETMRGWLGEGRVTGNTLVWRGDWPEWRMASAVFPQLMPASAPAPVVPPVAPAVFPAAPAASMPAKPSSVGAAFAPVAAVRPLPVTGRVLPVGQLPAGQFAMGQPMSPETPLDGLAEEDFEAAARRNRRRRRKSQDVTKIVTGVLVALTIVLVIILAFVVRNFSAP